MPALQAMKERLFYTLCNSGLTYRLKGTLQPINAGIVIPRPIWLVEGVPQYNPPYLCFSVESRGGVGRVVGERKILVKFWFVSADGADECIEMSESVRARFHLADQNFVPGGPAPFDAAATTTTYPIAIREMIEVRTSDVDYHPETKLWYVISEYEAYAI